MLNPPPTYDALAVANYFIERALKDGKSITPMGIQKLVYFAHGWMLAIYKRPLITQRIEAWDYGPVIRDLYQAFKRFGNSPITEVVEIRRVDPNGRIRVSRPSIREGLDPDAEHLLEQVWDAYKGFTSIQLSNLTHEPKSPWTLARRNNQPFIDDEWIKRYFSDFPK